MAKYNHLTLEEREKIYLLKNQGKSFREIARTLGRHHSTISDDWWEGTKYFREYIPCQVHERATKRAQKQRSKAPLKNVKVLSYVREGLKMGWSPEQIAGRLPIDHPGESIHHETIYRYIYDKGKSFKLWKKLPLERKKRRRKKGRGVQKMSKSSRIKNAKSIEDRKGIVNGRKQFGHFETDLMEGARSDKVVITVNVERKTRYTTLDKLSNKKSETKTKSLLKKLKMLESCEKSRKPVVRTITTDNGSENAGHREIEEELEAQMYFCHAYASWEKGAVENSILRTRRYIPKGCNISEFSDEQIQIIENRKNDTPRKCLGFRTPNEAMEEELNKYKFRKYRKSLE